MQQAHLLPETFKLSLPDIFAQSSMSRLPSLQTALSHVNKQFIQGWYSAAEVQASNAVCVSLDIWDTCVNLVDKAQESQPSWPGSHRQNKTSEGI